MEGCHLFRLRRFNFFFFSGLGPAGVSSIEDAKIRPAIQALLQLVPTHPLRNRVALRIITNGGYIRRSWVLYNNELRVRGECGRLHVYIDGRARWGVVSE